MCRPLKDIVAELEANYSERLVYDLKERSRIIDDFDKNVAYMFSRLEKYKEDVKFVLDHNLDIKIIRRMTLNLTLIVQHVLESLSRYDYVIEFYLMDDCYEKNRDLWSAFIDARREMKKLFDDLQENDIFGVGKQDDGDVIRRFHYDDEVYNNDEKVTETGMFQLNEEEVNKMNGAELMVCLDCLFEIFEDQLWELKNSAIDRWEPGMKRIYEFNYLVYAKYYWSNRCENFRAHITRQRLHGEVNINELNRLKQEAIYQFEYNTTSGKIWRDYSEDVTQMAIQMKEQFKKEKKNEDEEMWKSFFQNLFELEEYDRWIEELRNPPETEEQIEKRERLFKTNRVFNLTPANSKKVDILFLYQFIDSRFISATMHVYEWFALYYLLRRIGLLSTCTVEDFERQMNDMEWFGHVKKKCSANEINTYRFLLDKAPDAWGINFKPGGTNKASKKAIDNIYLKYSEIEDTIEEIYVKE